MLVILSGVSGAGKDTIKKELIKRMEDIISLPSFTSREPRPGEEEGVQYHFISKDEFKEKIATISENAVGDACTGSNPRTIDPATMERLFTCIYYGTSKKLMNEKIESGKIIVKDIEVNGTENLIKKLGNDTKLVTIFLKVDKEELKNRLINRGDNLSEADMQLRLNRLEYEESKIGLYDYVIKNDDLEKTVQIIMTIIENE